MSESDDIQEFVKLVGKGKPKGMADWTMYNGWRDPRASGLALDRHTTYSSEAYRKWRNAWFPNVKYFFDPKTGFYGIHYGHDPLKTDISKFIFDKWDAYRKNDDA